VNRIKLALVGQSGNLAPADKKLYALRDVTATVNSIPLIASSIMSKKIASGADAIVLDVKVGSGAFMKTVDDARKLAATMVAIGKNVGRRTIAVLSDMNEPLGVEIGNANEVQEAIDVLKGRGERKLTDICLTLASYMTVAGGVYPDIRTARPELERMLQSGQAVDTLRRFIEAQGGDPRIVEEPSRLPQPSRHMEVTAQQAGYVTYIDAEQAGIAAMLLGAGRQTKEEAIDYAVGITLKAKVGAYVQAGEPIAELHYNERSPEASAKLIREAVVVGTEKPEDRPVVLDVME
jgi:pyrimidine-nucleoside phosphorylase